MAGLENLFSIEPTLPSVQTHKLPDNPERWAEVLTTYLREQYPDVAKLPVVVEFRKRDDQSGTAMGALQVSSEEASKTVFVPFIVRKFELFPLDIWMEPKSQVVHPLTKDTFKEVFFVQSPAEGMDARPTDSSGTYFNDPSLWTTNYPPLQGRYSYASAGYPMLDQLSDTFVKEDGDSFRKTLQDNPHLVVKFQKHGHAEVLEKLARKSYPNTNDYVASAMQLIPIAVADVKKETDNKYSILSNVEGLFDTAEVQRVDRAECLKFLAKICPKPEDMLNEVDQEGEKMLIVRKPAPGVFLYDATEAGPEEATDFAVYRVKTKTGIQVNGLVIPRVVDFAGKKKNYKLFISRTHSSFQPSIAGIKMLGVDDTEVKKKILQPWDIRVGATGCFLFIDDGVSIATEPVTIKAIEGYGPQDTRGKLTVCDLSGKTFKVQRGYGDFFTKEEIEDGKNMAQPSTGVPGMKQQKKVYLDAHGMVEVRKDIFIIPARMMWIPMDGFSDVSATKNEWLMKEAADHMELDPLTVRWTGVVYDISGAGLPKLAMSEREARVLLATAGLDMEKISKVMKKAKVLGKAKAHRADRLASKSSKHSSTAALIAKIATTATALKTNLIKEAAEIQDDQATVDALLSLNFINTNNLSKFVAYKPIFDKVLDYLAELTLASRLGLKDVPESAAVTAMTKLLEVCDGLQKIQVSMKRPSTKTAAAPSVPPKAGKKYLPSKKGKLIAAIGG